MKLDMDGKICSAAKYGWIRERKCVFDRYVLPLENRSRIMFVDYEYFCEIKFVKCDWHLKFENRLIYF